MKMIHSCFLNSTLGSLELNFCIFQMVFCWSVCVAISRLFSIFNNNNTAGNVVRGNQMLCKRTPYGSFRT